MNVSLNHPVLEQLRVRDIPFNVCGPHIELDGFGKAGTVKLLATEKGDYLELHSRYDRVVPIHAYGDLVAEAWHWLWVSLARNNGLYVVHENWREAFIEQGWLPKGTLCYVGITREMWDAGEEVRRCSMSV
jgi:hypothetical protein